MSRKRFTLRRLFYMNVGIAVINIVAVVIGQHLLNAINLVGAFTSIAMAVRTLR